MTLAAAWESAETEPARAFFDSTQRAFADAACKLGVSESALVFADLGVRLRFAGKVIAAPFLRALAGHARHEGPVSLTINVWDGASSGLSAPRPTWTWEAGIGRGEIPALAGSAVKVALDTVGGAVSAYDESTRTAYYWTEDAARLPFQVSASPFRTILHWWSIGHGLQLAHAAAVGIQNGGCLLVGKAGAGKSTTAIASLLAGCDYLGDDCCVVGTRSGPYAWSAYGSSKLNADALERFPQLERSAANPERRAGEKAVIFVNEVMPERLVKGFPIRALLVPRIADQARCTVEPISTAAGFMALAPSTIFQLPLADARTSRALSQIASSLPCYELRLSRDPFAAVDLIRGLLA